MTNTADGDWKRINRQYHFFDALKLLNSKRSTVHPKWLHSIRRSCILAGQSYLARSPHEAFLSDMIAIETLLAQRGDRIREALTERLVALFGWHTNEESAAWKKLVDRLYDLRCDLVHDGHIRPLSHVDLYNADMLVSNVLLNVCKNWRHIRSKQDIISLAARLHAQKTLGLRLKRFGEFHFITPGLGRIRDARQGSVGDWPW